MHCFNHQDRDAVGICKSCGRGVCDGCARLKWNRVACREACDLGASDVLIRVAVVAGVLCVVGPLAGMVIFRAVNAGYFWLPLLGVAGLAIAFALAIRGRRSLGRWDRLA